MTTISSSLSLQPTPIVHFAPSAKIEEADNKEKDSQKKNIVDHTADFFANIGPRMRRSIFYTKTARDVPIYTNGGLTVIKTMQSNVITRLFQVLNQGQMERSDGTGKGDWMANPTFLKTVGPIRIAGMGITGGIAVYEVFAQIIEIKDELEKGRDEECAIATLSLTRAFADIGDAISSIAIGISMADAARVPMEAIAWATPLSMVTSALSVVWIALNFIWLKRSERIDKQLGLSERALNRGNGNALSWLREELTDSKNKDGEFYIKRNFDVINRERYAAQMLHIIDNQSQEDKKTLNSALKDRITDKIFSHKVAIISAIISLVGVAVLFFPVVTIPSLILVGGVFGGLSIVMGIRYLQKQPRDRQQYSLRNRVAKAWQNRTWPKLTVLRICIAVSLIALITLTSPVISPLAVGFGFVALSGLISFIKYIRDKRSVVRLEKRIDQLCDFDQIAHSKQAWLKQNAPFAVELAKIVRERKLKPVVKNINEQLREHRKRTKANFFTPYPIS